MANKNVNILLKLQDQFTGPMRSCGVITKDQEKAMRKVSSSVIGFSRNVRSTFLGGVAHVARFGAALAGLGGALSVAGISRFLSDAEDLAKAQIEAETKLEAVLGNVKSIASGGAEAVAAAKSQLTGVASELQKVGVIGDEVTLAGMQQLATYQLDAEQITILSRGMTDLLAQQKGLNATQEDAVSVANLIGKAMSGQVSALSRVGIIMDDSQKKMLQTGDATQRAAVLAEILQDNVGGVNKALADTGQGALQQFANNWGDMKEQVGMRILEIKASLAKNLGQYIPQIQDIAIRAVEKVSELINSAVGWIQSHSEEIKAAVRRVVDGIKTAWGYIQPVLSFAIKHAETLIPVILGVVGAISAASVVTDVATKVSFGVKKFIDLRNAVKEAGGVMSWLKTGPIGLIILGIAAAVAAVVYLWNNCEGFRNFVKAAAVVIVNAWNNVKTTAVLVKDVAVLAFNALKDKIVGAFNTVKEKVAPVIQWIKEKVDAIKQLIDSIKQAWQDLTSGPWVNNSGGGTGSELHGHALGTPYWQGGPTYVNEGRRGEIISLPSGTQIIPHDVAEKAVDRGTSVTVNVTVAGNVIGNRAFMEETGAYVARQVLGALATV